MSTSTDACYAAPSKTLRASLAGIQPRCCHRKTMLCAIHVGGQIGVSSLPALLLKGLPECLSCAETLAPDPFLNGNTTGLMSLV